MRVSLHPATCVIVTVLIALVEVQLYGLLAWTGLKLNAAVWPGSSFCRFRCNGVMMSNLLSAIACHVINTCLHRRVLSTMLSLTWRALCARPCAAVTVNLIMSMGIAVEFLSHIARAFMMNQGTRSERAGTCASVLYAYYDLSSIMCISSLWMN
jgi:hypothetical protein